jgi:glucose/arabinose dehydrogenase
VAVYVVADGLEHPWSLAFLPDGRMLVTERKSGDIRVIDADGNIAGTIGFPFNLFTDGQGGLLDIALAPDFGESGHVYLSFAEAGPAEAAGTALARAVLADDNLRDAQVIFRQEPKLEGPNHFGGRIAFDGRGHLYLTMGDRFKEDPAQVRANTVGTVARLNLDGTIPEDNPFVEDEGRDGAIWTYGHRNIEAAAVKPGSDELWVAEMGPMGGDELNRLEPGANYGWPLVSWGIHYDGRTIPDPSTRPELHGAGYVWTPSIAPSGMIFYTGDMFPDWQGSVITGGLVTHGLELVEPETGNASRVPLGARIRDVRQHGDGSIYVLTDGPEGAVWQVAALEQDQAEARKRDQAQGRAGDRPRADEGGRTRDREGGDSEEDARDRQRNDGQDRD